MVQASRATQTLALLVLTPPNKMGGTVKAWKQKASTWIKRALIIAGVVLATAIGLFLTYKAVVGFTKSRLRREIASLQAQVSAPAAAPSGPSPVELALLAKVLNK
jgi:hypothetical protein